MIDDNRTFPIAMRIRPAIVLGTCLVLVGLAAAALSVAQLPTDNQDSRRELVQKVQRDSLDLAFVRQLVAEMAEPPEGIECSLRYVLTVAKTRWNELDTMVSEVNYTGSAGAMRLESADILLVRDDQAMVTVVPAQRAIIVADVVGRDQRSKEADVIGLLRDTMFAHARVVMRTVEEVNDSTSHETLKLTMRGVVVSGREMSSMSIRYDRSRRRLIAMRAEFTRGEVQFAQIEYGPRACAPLQVSTVGVLDGIVGPSGRPEPRYEGFTVVDHRRRAG